MEHSLSYGNRKKVFFTANSFFALYNFRLNLIKGFLRNGFDVVLCAREDGYEKYFEAHDIQLFVLKETDLKLFQSLFFSFFIIKCIFVSKPDYVFSFTILNNITSGCARIFLNFRFVPNVTGLGRTWSNIFGRSFVKVLYKVFFRLASTVVVQNDRDFAVFSSILKGRAVIVKVNGSGVDLEKFKSGNRQFRSWPIRISMISRLVTAKGYILYLDALTSIKHKYGSSVEVDFVAGYSSDETALESLRRTYPDINFFNFKENIAEYLATVDVSVLPSSYNEGTPRILIESLAAGCAIITSNQAGCIETVSENKNGFLLYSLTTEELYDIVNKYLQLSLSARFEFSENSVFLSREKYDEELIILKYLSFADVN